MRRTVVDADGSVRCPHCGARDSFVQKRTGKAKLIGVATVGVGVVAMPKRLKCNGCGANLKRGGVAARTAAVPLSPRAKAITWAVVLVVVLVAYLTQH